MRLIPDSGRLRLWACDYAESILDIFNKEYSNDNRPYKAIELAKRYAHHKVEKDFVKREYFKFKSIIYGNSQANCAAKVAFNCLILEDSFLPTAMISANWFEDSTDHKKIRNEKLKRSFIKYFC